MASFRRGDKGARRCFELISLLNALCGVVSCLKIIGVAVPTLVDVRQQVNLTCSYDTGRDALFSVKWYKDEQEFYRYMPSVKPSLVTFPLEGASLLVDTVGPGQKPCGRSQCTVRLDELTTAASGLYTCEVSTEAPSFATMMETKNMTVAEFPVGEPRIEGLRAAYTIGDMLDITCKSAPSEPPAHLTLFVNNQEIHREDMLQASDASGGGSARLRMVLSRGHFKSGGSNGAVLRIVCSAMAPGGDSAPGARSAAAMAVLADPQALQTNQKLWRPDSSAAAAKASRVSSIVAVAILFAFAQSSKTL